MKGRTTLPDDALFKVKPMVHHMDDFLDLSEPSFMPNITSNDKREIHNNTTHEIDLSKIADVQGEIEGQKVKGDPYRETTSQMFYGDFESHSVIEDEPLESQNKNSPFPDCGKGQKEIGLAQVKGQGIVRLFAPPKHAVKGSDWDEFHKLRETVREADAMSSGLQQEKKQKCLYCLLVENLDPETIAPSLYEDSELSSGTLEEATLTQGVSRRAAVKTILKKLVNSQKEKGKDRECVTALAKGQPQTYAYLLLYLETASINDLETCTCTRCPGKTKMKIKRRNHVGTDMKQKNEGYGFLPERYHIKLLRTPGFTDVGPEYRKLIITCSQMHFLLDSAKRNEFEKYQKQILAKFHDNVDVMIRVLHRVVDEQWKTNSISSKTYKILEQTKELISKSNYPLLYEVDHLSMLSKVHRKEGRYGLAENYTNCMYQTSQFLFPQSIVMNQKRRDAEYLIHQFQNKFAANSVSECVFQRIENLYLCALQHSVNFQEFLQNSKTTAKYADDCYVSGRVCLIHLGQLYLRCCVTFRGTTEDFDVDSESIAKAEQCLQKVLTRWEGISSRTEGKYLLAMSDLHLRKKQYLKALEFANEALELCTKRNQLRMVEWAERRIRYVERRIGMNGVDVDRNEVSSGCEAGPSSGVESS